MGEIKSVKVDNWGVFFLQKLQNFFNKTDYCDLTLQFNDNSQLKVHKLVLNACTDYFNVLEQTCEMIDDILIMPNELQADLVVPIVNFMYTGTLEFELKMYGKLLKTARDMNMTVLLKLLEAHRRTMEGSAKQVVRNTKTSPRPTYLNAGIKPTASIPSTIDVTASTTPAKRRILSTRIEPYRKLQIKPISSTTYSDTNAVITTKYPNTRVTAVKGPSRFEYEGENILQDTFESSFDTISYESKPLQEDIIEDTDQHSNNPESTTSSQFEQLRRTGYNNNKRPAQSILQSPPAKKPNIQDVKEYSEQQRMRKQIAEEYGEEFQDTLDDEFHNADDDEEYLPVQQQTTSKTTSSSSNLKQKPQQNQIIKKTTNAKQEDKPRIVVKDSTSSNVDHAKIISEVLRKYPHLIKNNKNIKLKIMPNASGNGGPQRVVIKKDPDTSPVPSTSKTAMAGIQEGKLLKIETQVSTAQKGSTAQVQATSVGTVATPIATVQPTITSTTISQQPRRIDSKTMKALISLGAENTTGPWLCLRCGVNGRPISIPSYRGFRRHLINTHKETIDQRLCEHCGWRSTTHKELLFHMQMEHQIKCNINFPKCEHCGLVVLDLSALDDHIDEYHPENKEDNQQCIYCNKTFLTEILLYNHMKAQHKERAREDGVIDFSDDDHTAGEYPDDDADIDINNYEQDSNAKASSSKIQILSNINLPKCISLTKTTDLSAITITTSDRTLTNVDYITTSAGLETADIGPKFVNAEGNVMELTAAQRDEIISQLEQSGDGVVMVLNDESFANDEKITDVDSASSGKIQSITSQQFGDNNMLIVYDEQQPITATAVSEKTNEQIIENKEKRPSKEAVEEEDVDEEEMEWKNVNSQDEIEKDTKEKLDTEDIIKEKSYENKEKVKDNSSMKKQEKDSSDLDMKLKLLTGDWTEDEDEECEDAIDEREKDRKEKDKSSDDKILDILEKNNDSSDVTDDNIQSEPIEDNNKIEKVTEEQPEVKEEINNISEKSDDKKEIEPIKNQEDDMGDGENIKTEENLESNPDDYDKDEEILFRTEISFAVEDKPVEKADKNPTVCENDNDRNAGDSDAKESTDDTENVVKKEEENSEEKNNIKNLKEIEKSSVTTDVSVDEVENNENKKEHTDLIADSIEKLETDENKKKAEKNITNDEVKPITESKDDIDEVPQTKTKDEIKNLISEWGEDDDDL